MRCLKTWAGLFFFGLLALGLKAQDASVGVTVKLSASATVTGGQNGQLQLSAGFLPTALSSTGSFEETASGSGSLSLPVGTVQVQTGYVYTLVASCQSISSLQVAAVAARGYQVLFNNWAKGSVTVNGIGTGEAMISFCVLGRDRFSGRAGTCTSLATGQVKWQVALGGLKDGGSAGSIALVDPGTESNWNALYTTAALHYMSLSAEVSVYNDANGNLRQIMADQAFVDIVTLSSPTSFEIRFYPQSEVQGTSFPYTFSGLPYVTYRVQAGGSGNQLEIVSITHPASSLSGNTLSSSAPDSATPVARTATTILGQTGNSPNNYVWSLQDWTTSGSSPLIEHERSNVSGGSNTRTETRTVFAPGGATAVNNTNSFVLQNWGEEIASTQRGTTNPVTISYGYDTTASDGGYGFLDSVSSSDGSWKSFDYQPISNGNIWAGVVFHKYEPFGNSGSSSPTSGQITTFGFALDAFGMPTRLNSRTVTIAGSTFGTESVQYSTAGTVNNCTLVEAVDTKSPAGSPSITTTSKYFQEDSPDDFFRSLPYSAIAADCSMVAYAYERGTFSAGTFTPSISGTGSMVATITGTSNPSAGGASCTTYNSAQTDTIYLIAGKSQASVSYRDATALVQRTEQYVWLNSTWSLVGYTNYTYDAAGCLTATSSLNNVATSATLSGEQITAQVDGTGFQTTYTYDASGRISSKTNALGLKVTYTYDAAGHIQTTVQSGSASDELSSSTAYDLAGRVTQGADPGLGGATFAYSYPQSGGWVKTASYTYDVAGYGYQGTADQATRVETYQSDGRLASVGGSGVAVGESYTYSLVNGNLTTVATIASQTKTTVTDWLGRTISTTASAYGGASYQETYTYNAQGQLAELQRSNLAPIEYQYDAMGSVVLSGLDIGNDNLALGGNDRLTATNSYVEQYGTGNSAGLWLHQETDTYPTANSSTPQTVSIVRSRLTAFPANCTAETLTTNAYGTTVSDQTTNLVLNAGSPYGCVQVSTTVPNGANPETVTYNGGLKTKATAVDGSTTQWSYDGLERLSTSTDSRGNVTNYTPVSGSTLVSSIIDPLGGTTSYMYDPLGRQIVVTRADGSIVNTAYSAAGQVLAKWGTGATPVSYGYNSTTGLCTSVSTYRSAGTLASSTWTRVSAGSPDTITLNYDATSGLLTSRIDPAGNSVQYTYTVLGKVLQRTWAQNGVTQYEYDPNTGELTNVNYSGTPAPTTNIVYTYNRAGKKSSIQDATGTRQFIYGTAPGAPATELDEIDLSSSFYNSRVVTRLYNVDGLLPGRAEGFALGNTANPSADLIQSYSYNASYDLSQVSSSAANTTESLNYSYTANSQLVAGVTVAGSSNFSTALTYDARNMISTVQGSNNAGVVTEFDYTYNSRGQRLTALQKGSAYQDYWENESYSSVYNSFQYDGFGELTTAQMVTGNNVQAGTVLPGRQFRYTYDTAKDRASAGEHGSVQTGDNSYTTNNLNQYTGRENLTVRVLGNSTASATVSISGAVVSQLDRNFGADVIPSNGSGNVNGSATVTATLAGGTTKSYASNYMVPAENQSFTYDKDGNLTGDGVWTYTYDGENRLVSMTSSFLSETLNFTYDYANRRVEKQVLVNGAVVWDRRFVYDGHNVVAEVDAMSDSTQNDVLRSYTWGLDITGSLKKAAGVGALLEVRDYQYAGSSQTSTSYFPSYDGNGDVVSLIRADGALAVTYEYSPFGELLRNAVLDTAVADNPMRFSTKYEDKETELLYYGRRFYSPSLGRFLNRDPNKNGGGRNRYAFAGNDAIDRWDDLGMISPVSTGQIFIPTQPAPGQSAASFAQEVSTLENVQTGLYAQQSVAMANNIGYAAWNGTFSDNDNYWSSNGLVNSAPDPSTEASLPGADDSSSSTSSSAPAQLDLSTPASLTGVVDSLFNGPGNGNAATQNSNTGAATSGNPNTTPANATPASGPADTQTGAFPGNTSTTITVPTTTNSAGNAPNSGGGFVGGGGQGGGGGAGASWDGPTPAMNGVGTDLSPAASGTSGGLATAAGATGASAIAGPQLWSAGLNGGDQSVFWSGYAQGARGIAENLGGTTLEQTPIGGALDYLSNTVGVPGLGPVWNAASATFAGNATGTAQAVILAPGATWTNIELPTLLENGVEILFVVP